MKFKETLRKKSLKFVKCIGKTSLLKDPIFLPIQLKSQDLPFHFTCEMSHAYFIVNLLKRIKKL